MRWTHWFKNTCTPEPRTLARLGAVIIGTMDTKLLELLVCPVTKGPLNFDRERQELLSRSARLAYPVRNGIPILLENEARTLSDEEIAKLAADRPPL